MIEYILSALAIFYAAYFAALMAIVVLIAACRGVRTSIREVRARRAAVTNPESRAPSPGL